MDSHYHARLTWRGREFLARDVVEGRLTLCEAAAGHRVSRQTASKWVRRYREGGVQALADRSSRPQRMRKLTSNEQITRVEALRRERWTGVRIAQATGLSRATVSRILQRLKLNKARHLEPQVPVIRYEHAAPGDMLHIDIKKFARIAYTALYPDETANSSAAFLAEAAAYFLRLGITVRRVLTDNGPCFYAHRFAHACRTLAITHKRTRIYTPRTNGKAERFIQTAIREWAYARRYENSAQRAQSLQPWTHQYNWHRPHASLNQAPPISRSGLDVNNLLRHHS